MLRALANTLAFTLTALVASSAAGATDAPWPATMVMPWRTIGIDPDERARLKQAFEASHNALAEATVDGGRSLTQHVKEAGGEPTINIQKISDTVTVANEPASEVSRPPVALEPVLCSLAGRRLIFLTAADAQTGVIRTIRHRVIDRKTWKNVFTEDRKTDFLNGRTQQLTREILAADLAEGPEQSAFTLAFGLQEETSGRTAGSRHCLNLLAAQELAPSYRVVRTTGRDRLTTLKRLLKDTERGFRRPTRTLRAHWSNLAPDEAPMAPTLTAHFVESVLGQEITTLNDLEWGFSREAESLVSAVPQKLKTQLDAFQKRLRLQDMPQVSAIDRAWVYLDRGRGWGLHMSDRMVARTPSGDEVKGHVVRFFGAEKGITSPRGFPVAEGAVLFIRKGQNKTQKGMTFRFDPTQYPTQWPPTGSSEDG